MQTKKYIITGLLGLSFVGIGAFFLMRNQVFIPDILRDGNLLSYVPGYTDQLIYIEVDEGLVTRLNTMNTQQYDENFQQLVEKVDTALVTQYTTGDVVYNLLFLQGGSIDISELQSLGLLANAEEYQAHQLTDNIWVYGSPTSLSWQDNTLYTLQDNSYLQEFFQKFSAGGYNIGVVTYPSTEQHMLMGQFTDKLLYTAVMTSLGATTTGSLYLQFSDDVVANLQTDFIPQFAKYVDDDTILYLETTQLLSFLGIEREQFLSIVPVLLGKYGTAYDALLTQDDYLRLYQTLNSNMGILLKTSEQSALGLSATLLVNSPDMYTLLSILTPAWKGFLEGFVGSGTVSMETSPTRVAYTTHAPLFSGGAIVPLSLATLEQTDTLTIFSLFTDHALEEKSMGYMPVYNADTSVVFHLDNTHLEKLDHLGFGTNLPINTSSFTKGIMEGDIQTQADMNRVIVNFKILNN